MRILVIRSARQTVLQDFAKRVPREARVTVLGHHTGVVEGMETLTVPPGPFRWRRFGPQLRADLLTGRWSEIVVLHNQGDHSYAGIYAIVARIGPRLPLRIFFADGSERVYRSWLAFVVSRAPVVTAASIAWVGLVLILVPFWLAAAVGRRLRQYEVTS